MDKVTVALAARYARAWYAVYPDVLVPAQVPALYALAGMMVTAAPFVVWDVPQLEYMLSGFPAYDAFHALINLLKNDRRLPLFAYVLRAIGDYVLAHHNTLYMTLEASHELPDVQRNRIIDWARKRTQSDIIYRYQTNPALIAGFALYTTTYAWEWSLRKTLASYAMLMPSTGVKNGN